MDRTGAKPQVPDRRPLVSVIVPAYNAERYIGDAVDSILGQDYPHKEVIVVDDGSTDGTVARLHEYGDRIRLLHQPNSGAAAARNRGLAAARGEYLAFLDSDDIWLPGKLTAQVEHLLRHSHVDMVYGQWDTWRAERDGTFLAPALAAELGPFDPDAPPALVPEGSGWLYHRLLTDFLVWTSVVMLRRRLADRVGPFDERFVRGQDFDYWLRASRHTEIHMLDRPMALYRLHRRSATYGCPQRNYAVEIIHQALDHWGTTGPDGSTADPAELQRHLSRLWHGFGAKQLKAGHPHQALRAFVRAAWARPGLPRNWVMCAVSGLTLLGLWRRQQTLPERS